MDALAEFLVAHELGSPVERLELRAVCTLKAGTEVPWVLASTSRGVVLVAAVSASLGRVRDLSAEPTLRYVTGWTSDALEVDGASYGIPTGSGATARRLLATGRLTASVGTAAGGVVWRHDSPVVDAVEPLHQQWVEATAVPGEQIVAWLESAESASFEEGPLGSTTESWWVLVSDERSLRVAISRVGDVKVEELGGEPWRLDSALARGVVTAGEVSWRTGLRDQQRWAVVTRLAGGSRDGQLRAAAAAASGEGRASLLADLAEPTPCDAAVRALLTGDVDGAIAALVPWCADGEPAMLVEVAADFGWTDEQRRGVVHGLLSTDSSPQTARATLPLHAELHGRLLKSTRDGTEQAMLDLQLAEHLLLAEDRPGAAAVLEARLEQLPDEGIDDVLPPAGADLTVGEGGQHLRVRVLELLVSARGGELPDVSAAAALARLQPLRASRVEQVRAALEASPEPSAELESRVNRVARLLDEGGLTSGAETLPLPEVRTTLSDEAREKLRHPLVRSGGLFAWAQSRLARPATPDSEALRAFAQRLTAGPVVDAVADTALALGGRTPIAYVSHGERGIGIVAWDGDPPMLVVGGRHLESEGALGLTPTELRFAVGSELAHLRYGHARVTSAALWAGAWDTSLAALDVLGTVLALGGGRLVTAAVGRQAALARVQRIVPTSVLDKALGAGDQLGSWVKTGADQLDRSGWGPGVSGAGTDSVGPRHEELLAAHRVLQLTADRAGLLMCGDPIAAIRALWLTDARLSSELAMAERHGLVRALRRRGDDGAPVLQALAARIAALLSFWLSDDYVELRAAMGEEP